MPGYTTRYGFPYPLTGDPIYLGATQQKDMADSIDSALWAAGVPVVAQTNPPRCKAVRSTNQSVPNTTDTIITFPTKDYDSEAIRVPASPQFVAGGSTITCRVAGVYTVSSSICLPGSGNRNIRILLNGTSALGNALVTSTYTTAVECMQVEWTGKLAVNDVIRIMVWHSSGSAQNAGPTSGIATQNSWVSMTYEGPTSL